MACSAAAGQLPQAPVAQQLLPVGPPAASVSELPLPLPLPADEDPENARGLMRAGAFNGLRDNIKAVGEYAVGAGEGRHSGALGALARI